MAGLYRRGKTWWGRAQRDGREYRRSLKTTDRATAEKRLRKWLGDLDEASWSGEVRHSYAEAEERFIREHLTAIKPSAATRYGVSLKHLSEHFGGLMLDQIGSAELSEFETKRRQVGVSPSTIRRDFACLSSMLTSAMDWEWLKDGSNPVPSYLRRRAKRGLKEAPAHTRYLSEDEEARLLESATTDCRSAITLAIDTGLRREELFGLEWSQVDLSRGVITTTTRTKSGRSRMVPLPARSAQILAQQKRYPGVPHVLVNPDTKERYVQMNKGLEGARRRSGIARLCWHDLRRTAGCRWLQRDRKSMEEVSILLGHSSVLVTEKSYAFLNEEAIARSLSGVQMSAQGQRTKHRKGKQGKAVEVQDNGL
jgi:integrase